MDRKAGSSPIVGRSLNLILDTTPSSGVLSDLVRIAGGDPRHVLTITDFAAAAKMEVRDSFGEDTTLCYGMLPEFARWAAEGRLSVPMARTFTLNE